MPNLFDRAVQRQVLLERLKAGETKRFAKVFDQIAFIVRASVGYLDDPLSAESVKVLNEVLSDVRKQSLEAFDAVPFRFEEQAEVFAIQEVKDLGMTGAKILSPKNPYKVALRNPLPFSGEKMSDFIGKMAGDQTTQITNRIRRAWAEGMTNQQLLQSVIGTKKNLYKDGLLEVGRRQAQAVLHTSIQHVSNSARQAVWEQNKDIVKGRRWVSTLDSRTSQTCKSLDGQELPLDKGPRPPIHVRCRSTTVAVLADKYSGLQRGRTRSSLDGPIPAKQSYYDWLKGQSPAFQDKALGPHRGKLFRDGGLSAERFRALNLNRNFEPLTLEEMAEIEPEAFEKADL